MSEHVYKSKDTSFITLYHIYLSTYMAQRLFEY